MRCKTMAEMVRDQLQEEAAYRRLKLEQALRQASGVDTMQRLYDRLNHPFALYPEQDEPTPEERAQARLDAEEHRRQVSERQAEFGRRGGLKKVDSHADRDARIIRRAQALQDEGHTSWAAVIANQEGITATRVGEIVRKAKA